MRSTQVCGQKLSHAAHKGGRNDADERKATPHNGSAACCKETAVPDFRRVLDPFTGAGAATLEVPEPFNYPVNLRARSDNQGFGQ